MILLLPSQDRSRLCGMFYPSVKTIARVHIPIVVGLPLVDVLFAMLPFHDCRIHECTSKEHLSPLQCLRVI